MHRLYSLLAALILLLPAARGIAAETTADAALTVDQVVARHAAARGGLESWRQVAGLRSSGFFTGFSQRHEFVRHQMRDGRYHLDHTVGSKRVVIGYDGELAWWINLWYDIDWPIPLAAADRAVLWQDAELSTPLMDYAAKGHQLSFAGRTEIDGQWLLQLDLERATGEEETWYLDPDTYLEVARDSAAADFGRPARQRTFFDDFRSVQGLVLPHLIESEFGTRHRVMEIDRVEILQQVDSAIFAKPLPGQMGVMGEALEGEWQVKVESWIAPRETWVESSGEATFTLAAGGGLVREVLRYSGADGAPAELYRTLTYDRFRQRYQLTEVNDSTLRSELFEGNHQGPYLRLDNLQSGTAAEVGGQLRHARRSCQRMDQQQIVCEHESSTDGGETWIPGLRLTYQRRHPQG